MTSVLYSAGLNYQTGNPVRQEIVAVRREVSDLRKQVETLTEENQVYHKYIMKVLKKDANQDDFNEFTREIMSLSSPAPQQTQQNVAPGTGTVQGGGFRR
jgi:hypothetical protein